MRKTFAASTPRHLGAEGENLAWLAFILGAGAYVHVRIGGYLAISEALLVCLVSPYLFLRFHRGLSRTLSMALSLGVLWLFSACVSDLHAGTAPGDMLKGLSRVVLLLLSVYSLVTLFRGRPGLYRWFLGGLLLSSLISSFYGGAGYEQGERTTGAELSWDRNYVYVAFFAVLLLASIYWTRAPRLVLSLVVLMGLLFLGLGSRNIGAILAVGGVLAYLQHWRLRARGLRRPRMANSLGLLVVLFLACVVVTATYSKVAALGWLGDKAKQKYEVQSSGSYGLLLSGRPEVLGGLLAVRQSPFLGYGSWAMDRQGFMVEAIHILGLERWGFGGADIDFGRIPAHSHLLEAWTEHGLLAIGFWCFVLLLIARVFLSGALAGNPLMPVLCIQFLLLLWNICLSPLGARVPTGAVVAMLILVHEQLKKLPPVRPRPVAGRSGAKGALMSLMRR